LIPPNHRERVLLHLHWGGRVLFPGEAGTWEAVFMAGFAGFKVISVDYRMPPDFPFPAALDDAVTVYRELLKTTTAGNVGMFGNSAGGSLILATLLRAKMENLPMPGAIAPGSPTVDLSNTGDSLFTNAMVDNQIGTWVGFGEATATLYANLNSDRIADILALPFCAIRDQNALQQTALFDHLVGTQEK
jgi:epsilon-lactone hydrolase